MPLVWKNPVSEQGSSGIFCELTSVIKHNIIIIITYAELAVIPSEVLAILINFVVLFSYLISSERKAGKFRPKRGSNPDPCDTRAALSS